MTASLRVSLDQELSARVRAECDRRNRSFADIVGDAFAVYEQIDDREKARLLGVPEEYFLNVIEGHAQRSEARARGDSRAG